MKQILKILTVSFILQTNLSGCKASDVGANKNIENEDTQAVKSKDTKQNYNDVNDLMGCQAKFELGEWYKSKAFDGWQRHSASIGNGLVYEGESYLDSDSKDNSAYIAKQKKYHIAYIGPWQPTTFTHTEGSFFNKKKVTEEKQIRFVAYQSIDYKNSPALNYHGSIHYFFESMNDQNKNIPAKSLSLLPDAVPNEFYVCAIKWANKFGYNAVAEVKSKNPFSKNYLVPTGKIIEAKE